MLGAIANFTLPILKNVGRSLLGSFLGQMAPRAASALGSANIPINQNDILKAKKIYQQQRDKNEKKRRAYEKQVNQTMRYNSQPVQQQQQEQYQTPKMQTNRTRKIKKQNKQRGYLRRR